MKLSYTFAATAASLSLGIAAATAFAHPGQMGDGTAPQMKGGMHGMKGDMGRGAMEGGPAGPASAQHLMAPEERTAMHEKMRNAKSPKERRQIAAANHAEMQKRAKEKGITLPEGRGSRFGATPQAPATTEHSH